jgi:hypothetical protein
MPLAQGMPFNLDVFVAHFCERQKSSWEINFTAHAAISDAAAPFSAQPWTLFS